MRVRPTRSLARRRAVPLVALGGSALLAVTVATLVPVAVHADPLPTSLHVNFQPSGAVPSGYTADTGVAYNGVSGWTDLSGNPIDYTANTRRRAANAASPDARTDTLVQMQTTPSSSGNMTPGEWTSQLANGWYSVTATVGDDTATNSTDVIVAQPGTAQQKTVVDHFVPTTSSYFATATAIVNVTNGALTLSPSGGSNTKLDYVDVVPAPADTTAPTVSVTPSGQASSTAGTYYGSVTVTVSATDDRGVTATSYSLDNGPYTSYSGPITVSGLGQHTVTATAQDAAGNVGNGSSTFTISTAPTPTSAHVNFQPAGATPSGYTADTGVAYNGVSGWTDLSGNPLNFTSNTRRRNSSASPDARYDTLIQMQATSSSSGNTTPGEYVTTLQNGWYTVTVAVGDATATNSTDVIVAQPGTPQQKTVVDHFVPTSSNLFATATATVDVENGALTLSPAGGTNTKLDFLDVVPAGPDQTPPNVGVFPAGSPGASSTDFYGTVTVTIKATDDRAVASTTYTVDGGPTTTYSGPFSVTGVGSHTVNATATDTTGNATTVASTFTISNPPPPTSAHVQFEPVGKGTQNGYVANHGEAYSDSAGMGWEDQSSGAPLNMVGNARSRNSKLSPSPLYDSFLQMQEASNAQGGTTTPGRFEVALTNGTYTVKVAMGDPTNTNSVFVLHAESGTANAVTLVDHYTPTSSAQWITTSGTVTVSDGRLTLDGIGGTNDKLNFIDVTPYTAPDTTPPTESIALSGTPGASAGTYAGDVQVTINAADETGGSGLASVTYTLDGGGSQPYSGPFTVASDGSHTVTATATDKAGNTSSTTTTWSQAEPARLKVAAPTDGVLPLGTSRLVFSSTYNHPPAANQQLTFTNIGGQPLTINGLSLAGNNPSEFTLPDGTTSLTIAPGTSQTVSVGFNPAAPTGCPTSSSPSAVGNVTRSATLTFSSNDPNAVTSEALSGIVACGYEGANEPTLAQVVSAFGYTTVTGSASAGHSLGDLRYTSGTDEISSPYWVSANPNLPVTLTPLAHYSGRNTSVSNATGWFPQGSTYPQRCDSTCTQLWNFPADPSNGYTENQKLLPTPSGTTSFTPSGNFGIFSGDYGDVLFSDDTFNIAHQSNGSDISPVHYIHGMRIYPAYGPGHVQIPGAYIIAIDITRIPAQKNNDFQDVVMLMTNAAPAVATAGTPGSSALSHNLTSGGTVSGTCAVTGFDGVLPNSSGTQCAPGNIAFGANGLTLTSGTGQLATGDQQDALYDLFNASQGQFTVTARVVGPITQLTQNYQQIGEFFGPDINNFVKVEMDHTSNGTDPHVTMQFSQGGSASTVGTVSLPSLTSASTVDLIIVGNDQVPDPIATSSDTYKVHGWPLDQVTAYYSINGATPVQIGTAQMPNNLATWFSTSAKAGILVSNSGTTTPVQATFSSFAITK